MTIFAVAGKGGVGKTTTAGLLVSRLIAKQFIPVLAVDADPNTCLDEVLGVHAEKTIGGVREEARKIASEGMSSGISKQQLLELKISESMVEADNFDLIAMGRPEGAGCYCYANNVLKQAIGQISSEYPYIVLDNEAGLENLSRRIIQKVNYLIIVTDPSNRGLNTVERIYNLSKEMKVDYDHLTIIINRLRKNELSKKALEMKKRINADLIIGLPDDDELADYAEEGKNLQNLSPNNKVVKIIDNYIETINLK